LFAPHRFPLPLKTLILLGFLMFSYGNALYMVVPHPICYSCS